MFFKDEKIYVNDSDAHGINIAPTGGGKSRASARLLIDSIKKSRAKESAVICDPKGELYKSTAGDLKEYGIDCVLINFRDPDRSDGWNPLEASYVYYEKGQTNKAEQSIDSVAQALMSCVSYNRDPFWSKGSELYMGSNIKMILPYVPSLDYYNLRNIIPLCTESALSTVSIISKETKQPESVLNGLRILTENQASGTRSGLFATIQTGLGELVRNEALLRLLSRKSISLSDVGKKPIFVYIIYPDERESMDFAVRLFIRQIYQALCDVCETQKNDRLPVRVNYIMDEFSNLAKIDGFENMISESRSKNQRFFLFVQAMEMLESKYDKTTAATILSNASDWVCFSSKEIGFLKYLSELTGDYIDYKGRRKPLLSPSDMQYLRKGDKSVEVVILRQGVRPYVTKLPFYDCTNLPNPNYQEPGLPRKVTANSKYILSEYDWMTKITSGEYPYHPPGEKRKKPK